MVEDVTDGVGLIEHGRDQDDLAGVHRAARPQRQFGEVLGGDVGRARLVHEASRPGDCLLSHGVGRASLRADDLRRERPQGGRGRRHAYLDQRPLLPRARLLPEDQGGTGLPAGQIARLADCDVGITVRLIRDVDLYRSNTADDCPADLAVDDGLQQDDKGSCVPGRRRDALDRHGVGERLDALGGCEDGRVDAERRKAAAIGAAVVLDQHDPCLPERLRCLTARSLLTLKVVPGRIDERVERRRRDLQRITGLDLS